MKAGSKAEAVFQRGLAALAQWVEKEGKRSVPRNTVVEITVDGGAEPVPLKPGVWLSNTKQRRDKLTAEQGAALAALGMAWAAVVTDAQAAPQPPTPQPAPSAAPGEAAGAGAPRPRIVADMRQVAFMDSSGINILIAAHRSLTEAGGWLRLAAAGESVMRTISIVGVDALIDCHETLRHALTD
ncbi:STAS domain-containing protein [Streptomyces sp. SudanB182_2057]|uniref:STAS domain-containing protein n=1 Tax=Streptomyces sp. SudanB182_2057 TaxID=3035281 RepID=UPI003F54CB45